MKNTSLSIIIPAYNEEGSIYQTIERVRVLAQKQSWNVEIIVVNDGSKDDTGKIASQSGAIIINHPINGGYGLSLQHGIKEATHQFIAIIDADGTYPVEELPRLVEMVTEDGYDMAIGTRSGAEYRKGIWKYPARIIFRWLAEYVAGQKIPDINSGLRVIKRDKLLQHYERTCLGFSFTTSITLIFMLKGYFVGYTPVSYASRIGKSKIKHFRDSLRTAQIMISVIAYHNPLKLFLLIAILNFVFSLVFIIPGIILNIFLIKIIGGIFFGSIPAILALGCLAELIRLSIESKK